MSALSISVLSIGIPTDRDPYRDVWISCIAKGRWILAFWDHEKDYKEGNDPEDTIELLRPFKYIWQRAINRDPTKL